MSDLFALLFGRPCPDLPGALAQGLLRLKDAGALTLREALVMHCVLAADTPPTITEIAILVGAPQPSISRCIQRLERMGLVERTIGHGRRVRISPTVSARGLIDP